MRADNQKLCAIKIIIPYEMPFNKLEHYFTNSFHIWDVE